MTRGTWRLVVAAAGLGLWCAGPVVAAPKKKTAQEAALVTAAVQDAVNQARKLMLEGQRKQALAELDRARALLGAKGDARDLDGKRGIFAEQFLTSDSFQKFQEARGEADVDRWDECLRELEPIDAKDQDNLLVVRLRAKCQYRLKLYDAAAKSYQEVLGVMPGETDAAFSLVEIALAQRRVAAGQGLLAAIEPRTSADIEKKAILRARFFELGEQATEALEVLREDQETHLDHVEVLYELGMLYSRVPGHDWPARKTLSLFVGRCKRMKDSELKARRLEALLPAAQSTLAEIDKKLGV